MDVDDVEDSFDLELDDLGKTVEDESSVYYV
jgi:hypothetical protein